MTRCLGHPSKSALIISYFFIHLRLSWIRLTSPPERACVAHPSASCSPVVLFFFSYHSNVGAIFIVHLSTSYVIIFAFVRLLIILFSLLHFLHWTSTFSSLSVSPFGYHTSLYIFFSDIFLTLHKYLFPKFQRLLFDFMLRFNTLAQLKQHAWLFRLFSIY